MIKARRFKNIVMLKIEIEASYWLRHPFISKNNITLTRTMENQSFVSKRIIRLIDNDPQWHTIKFRTNEEAKVHFNQLQMALKEFKVLRNQTTFKDKILRKLEELKRGKDAL